jgi:hypothetical protein
MPKSRLNVDEIFFVCRFGSADNLTTLHEKEVLTGSKNPMGSSSLPRDHPGSRSPALYAGEQLSSFEDEGSI